MGLAKLGSIAIRFAHRQQILQRLTAHETKPFSILRQKSSSVSTKTETEDDDLDKPIRFSTSRASTWDPVASRLGTTDDEVLWYQPLVVSASAIIFMIYFFILREENDIDERLSMDLRDHFPEEARKKLEASQMIANDYVKQGGTAYRRPGTS